jgi:hemin uptake protein HemP
MTDSYRYLRVVNPLPGEATSGPPRRRPYLLSTELFGEDDEILIVHRGQEYRLRITKENKLILTK